MGKYGPSVPPTSRPLESARRLFGVSERSGWYRYEARAQRLRLLEPEARQKLELPAADAELTRSYLQWCERTWEPGDCLRLLGDSLILDNDGKYALAMAVAHSKVLGPMKEELGRLVNPTAVVATVVGGLTVYAVLLTMPEPISKGIAALLTLAGTAFSHCPSVLRVRRRDHARP